MFGVNARMHFHGCVCKVVSSLILLFVLLQSECWGARFPRSSCSTVWKQEGTCVLLSQCPILLDVVNALQSSVDQNIRRNQINHLQKSQCGGTAKKPMVCCPKEHKNVHLVNQVNCGDAYTGIVANGNEAIPFECPWMALIAYEKGTSCSTVWKQEGTCVLLCQCPILLDVVKALQSSVDQNTRRNQINHLQKSQCGCTAMEPMVCCPKEHKNLHLVNQVNCGDAYTGKVANGNEAIPFEFPWMALIAYEKGKTFEYECGGSLINSRYVLTAAHCIKTRYKAVGVRLGEHNIRQPADCYINIDKCPCVQDIEIEKTIVHEHYNNKMNDIGLIRLAQDAVMILNVFPICLPVTPTLRLESLLDKLPWIAGWGTTETSHTISNVLRKAKLRVISNTECQDMFSTFLVRVQHISALTKGKFCAFGPKGEDSCRGDSGGPLMLPLLYNNEVRYIIYGIISYGSGEYSDGIPSVFTEVGAYLEWILDNLRPFI